MTGVVAVAFTFLLFATYLLSYRVYVWDALLFLGLALSAFGVVLYRSITPRSARRALRGVFLPPSPLNAIRLVALLLAVGVAWIARALPSGSDFTALLWLWGLAIAGFCASLVWPVRERFRQAFLRDRKALFEATWLGGLLLLAALVRFWGLGHIPYTLGGDEGTQVLAGVRLIEPPLDNPFATGWYSVPTMSFFLFGSAMRALGVSMAGARALSAASGVLTVLGVFWLGRMMGGPRVGWIAAVLVTFSAYHIHFSRLASNQIFDPLIGVGAAALLWWWLSSSGPIAALACGLAGMVAGMGWYAYFGARWVTPMLALFLLWRAWQEPGFFFRRRGEIGLGLCGWLIVTLPLWGWYLLYPSALTERYNAVSIFASGWLAQARIATGKSTLALLGEQFWKSFTAFSMTPDPTFWYYPQKPLVDFITSALLWLGIVAAALRWRWPGRALVLWWFGSGVVMGWALTENPPSSQRGLLLVPAVALLAAWGVESLCELLPRYRRYATRAIAALLCLIALLNLVFYFGEYTPARVYGNTTAEAATALAHFIQAQPSANSTVYFFGPPFLYWDFGTLAFLLRDQPGANVNPDEPLPEITGPARFVFVPERAAEMDAVQERYPGGRATHLRAPDARLLMIIYDWPGL